ncbi:MAG: FAD-dependent oxidoreductase, partial [Lentisphaeria bacterium]|nr:FAD-dependent oxidoreductase [Lentisphaeria bacterium]
MKELTCDIAVIGAGAAGLSAASAAASCGADTVVIDREEAPGGVLLQCIHNGFGLHYFKEELTGPEYASRMALAARKAQVRMLAGHTAVSITPGIRGHELILYSGKTGVTRLSAGAVILATGCRERTRANISVSGDRPAGVFTAGLAQKLVNIDGVAPGKRAVIVGSGDIGLIMARRLTWSGVEVARVVEIQPYPSGLARNIAQCLDDFGIQLDLATRITGIFGRDRVESV